MESSTFKNNTGGTGKDVYWYGEYATINNCKSYTTEEKSNMENLHFSGDATETTAVNGFDVTVVKSSSQIKVTKTTPKLTAKSATLRLRQRTKKYAVTLKNNKNKVMKNIKLTLKVKDEVLEVWLEILI